MARCNNCGGSVNAVADYCPRCGAQAPVANSLRQLAVVSLVIAAVATVMVYLGTDPNAGTAAAGKTPSAASSPP